MAATVGAARATRAMRAWQRALLVRLLFLVLTRTRASPVVMLMPCGYDASLCELMTRRLICGRALRHTCGIYCLLRR